MNVLSIFYSVWAVLVTLLKNHGGVRKTLTGLTCLSKMATGLAITGLEGNGKTLPKPYQKLTK